MGLGKLGLLVSVVGCLARAAVPAHADPIAPAGMGSVPLPDRDTMMVTTDGTAPRDDLELSQVELDVDGQTVAQVDPSDGAPGWNGRVTPGPHTLLAILVFRPRHPDPDRAVDDQVVRVTRHQEFDVQGDRALSLTISGRPPTGEVIEPFASSP